MTDSKNMRVIFYVPDFWAGGAQKQAALLFSEVLSKLNGNALLIYVRDGPNSKWLEPSIGSTVKLKYSSLSDPRIILDLQRHAAIFRATHLISWLHAGDTVCGLARITAIGRKFKWVCMERDSSYPRTWKFLLREFLVRWADRVICNSRPGANFWFERGLSTDQVGTIKNIIVDPDIKDPRLTKTLHDGHALPRVVSWGRLEPQKDPLRVVDAFHYIASKGGVECLVGGTGSLSDTVCDRIRSLDNVKFGGYIEDPQIYLERLPVFLSLSKHEGTPNAVLEAISANCIPVLSDIDEHRDIVGSDYPFLVDSSASATTIGDACLSALTIGENERTKLLRRAKDFLASTSPSQIATSFLDELSKVR